MAIKPTGNTSDWQIWVNGVNQPLTIDFPASNVGNLDNANDYYIATIGAGIGSDFRFGGRMDEMQYYVGGTPSAADVAHIYNSGDGNFPPASLLPDLRARYSFDAAVDLGGNQWELADDSGNGNEGTGFNMLTSPLVAH